MASRRSPLRRAILPAARAPVRSALALAIALVAPSRADVPRAAPPVSNWWTFTYAPSERDDSIAVLVVDAEGAQLHHGGIVRHPIGTRRPLEVHVHPSGRFAYVAHAGSVGQPAGVSLQAIDAATGRLEFRAFVASTEGRPRCVLDEDGTRAWLVDEHQSSLRTFAIDERRGTWHEDQPPAGTGLGPWRIVLDPTGRFLLVLNRGGCSVSRFRLDGQGRPSSLGADVTLNGSVPVEGCIDPTGTRFFVTLEPWDLVLAMAIDPRNAQLYTLSAGATGSSPHGLAYSEVLERLYVAESATDSVSAWDVEAEHGQLGARLGPFPAGEHPKHLRLSPDEHRLWVNGDEALARVFALGREQPLVEVDRLALPAVAESLHASAPGLRIERRALGLCAVDAEGRAVVVHAPEGERASQRIPVDLAPDRLAIDPFGGWIAVADSREGALVTVPVGADGRVGQPRAPLALGHRIASVAADPSGRFLAVAAKSPPRVVLFGVERGTAALEQLHELALTAAPDSIVFDPTGTVLCLSQGGKGQVSAVRVDEGSFVGLVRSAELQGRPGPLAMSPCGERMYVGLADASAVVPVAIERAGLDGAPTLVPSPALGAGVAGVPVALEASADGARVLVATETGAEPRRIVALERSAATGALRLAASEPEASSVLVAAADLAHSRSPAPYEARWLVQSLPLAHPSTGHGATARAAPGSAREPERSVEAAFEERKGAESRDAAPVSTARLR